MFLLARLQNDRFQQPRDVSEHSRPVLIVDEQRRLQSDVPFMALDNLIHKSLKEFLTSSNRSEGKRLAPLERPAPRRILRISASVELYRKRPSRIPEPVPSRRRNQRQGFAPECCIEVHPADPFEEVLLQKPLFHPYERCVIVFDGDHHRGLPDKPLP